MKPSTVPLFATILLLPSLSTAVTIDCNHIRANGKKFNFKKIGGPHSVSVIKKFPPSVHNTTWTVDLCGALKKDKKIESKNQCPTGTYVCGILTRYDPDEDEEPQVDEVFPIAGSYATTSGRSLDPKYERLEDIPYSDMTGLRIELNGGKYNKQNQKAVIDMQCDPERTGNEKSPFKKGKGDEDEKLRETETDENDEANSLRFVSYEVGDDSKDIKVLRLDWRTKYACESYEEDDDEGSEKDSDGKHWGFFTWFIVILFLGISAYLIFGSWLNYNRYGARGWDLLPHGDTIRDIPYLFRDWSKRVINTVQGGGSRGGYSAV